MELIVTLAILSMVGAAISGLLLAGIRSFEKAGQIDETQQSARVAMNKVSGALREAIEIDTGNTKNDQIVFRYQEYQPDNTEATYTIRIIREADNNLYWEKWSDGTNNFNDPSRQIGSSLPIADNIMAIQILSPVNNKYVNFSITAGTGSYSIVLRNAVYLRNDG